MKSVTGKIVSSTPIPLAKASKIISKFAETEDNGASQAVKAYLRRSAAAFNELKKLHRELETSSKHKDRKAKSEPAVEAADEPSREPVPVQPSEDDGEWKKHENNQMEVEKSEDFKTSSVVEDDKKEERNGDEVGAAKSNGGKLKHKKKTKDPKVHEKEDGSSQKTVSVVTMDQSGADVHEVKDGGEAETKEGKKKKKRKRKEVEEMEEDGAEPIPEVKQSEEKKKKKKKDKDGDQGQAEKDGVKTETAEWKDRKGADVDGDEVNDSSETPHKKKKKKRIKGEAES